MTGFLREHFGIASDGSVVERVTLQGGGLTLKLMSWGAVVQDLRLADHEQPLVLGFAEFAHYPAHSPYFGATAGRYANRIRDGRFMLDGVEHQLDRNFLGKHLLHGGSLGIAKRNWRFTEVANDRAVLEITDRDGEMGFPGTCLLRAIFSLPGDGVLAIAYEGTTDAPTLVNLAHHSYFNLGGEDILGHEIMIDAPSYLPVDEELIPTGEIAPVAGTARDFRTARVFGPDGPPNIVHDHNYCLSDRRVPLRAVAQVRSPASGVRMQVSTSEPGLQFYAGHKLDTPVPGLQGKPYKAYAGFCMEPQVWPDSPNHPHFPQAVLRPGEHYTQQSSFRFWKD
jgi:aldose 1-epimerase